MTAALARLASNPTELDTLHDPAERMIEVCTRAKEWLSLALDSNDIEQIAEVKSQAEALRVYAIQKQIGKDAELSAQELVRRAERGIGVAIRLGQERGEIETQQEARTRAVRVREVNQGRGDQIDDVDLIPKPKPTDFADKDELSNGIYFVTDDVPEEMFDEAIEEAKKEKNLSRANVVRKVKAKKVPVDQPDRLTQISEMAAEGHNSRQIAKEVGVSDEYVRKLAREYDIEITADKLTGRRRRIDPNRIVNQLVLDVAAATSGLDLVEFPALNGDDLEEWASSLSESLRTLDKFARRLKKELTDRGQA